MARTRSEKVTTAKQDLLARLHDLQPGARFLSTRETASAYGMSYQTAHRLLEELEREGSVERRAAAGTFVPGGVWEGEATAPAFSEAWLIFDGRARRVNSFGARLLAEISARLRRTGVAWQVCWAENAVDVPPDVFPVLWEAPAVLAMCRRAGRRALLLNARAAPGLDAAQVDSVAVDDAFGGACAADLLRETGRGTGLAVVTGPNGDPRSEARRDGFLSRAPRAAAIGAGGWYAEDGLKVAAEALASGPNGIFCANDRLAEGVLRYAEYANLPRPRIVGFDDAPIAATYRLTTIALPWQELAADATEIIRRRLERDSSASRQRIVTPQPVRRLL